MVGLIFRRSVLPKINTSGNKIVPRNEYQGHLRNYNIITPHYYKTYYYNYIIVSLLVSK